MDTLQIQIPEGHEIDTTTSDLEKGIIKFKKKTFKRWLDNPNRVVSGYYISSLSTIKPIEQEEASAGNLNTFATKEQALSALAQAQLSEIIANDYRFGGPITKKEWNDNTLKYVIERAGDNIKLNVWSNQYHFLAFHSFNQRELFLKENEDLIKQYFML